VSSLAVVCLLRVFYFEKGAAYYLHNAAERASVVIILLCAALMARGIGQF
jgi:uncharacterized membrane protein